MNENVALLGAAALGAYLLLASPGAKLAPAPPSPAVAANPASPFTDPCFRDPRSPDCERKRGKEPAVLPKTPKAAVEAVEGACINESELVCGRSKGLELVACVRRRGDAVTSPCGRLVKAAKPLLDRALRAARSPERP